jgi:hypothetical protein
MKHPGGMERLPARSGYLYRAIPGDGTEEQAIQSVDYRHNPVSQEWVGEDWAAWSTDYHHTVSPGDEAGEDWAEWSTDYHHTSVLEE